MSRNEEKMRFTQQMKRVQLFVDAFFMSKQPSQHNKSVFEKLKIEKRQQKTARGQKK